MCAIDNANESLAGCYQWKPRLLPYRNLHSSSDITSSTHNKQPRRDYCFANEVEIEGWILDEDNIALAAAAFVDDDTAGRWNKKCNHDNEGALDATPVDISDLSSIYEQIMAEKARDH